MVSAKDGNLIKSRYEMLKLNTQCTRFESNYSSCTGRSYMKIHVTAMEALRKKERQDETQFTTKIGGKTSLGRSYFALYNFHSQLHV